MPDSLKYCSKVTDLGSSKLLAAAASGRKVDIKYIALGDGGGEYIEPDKSRTELANECYRTEIKSFKQDELDRNQLIVKCDIPSEIGNFTLREAGLFDAQGDLIIVCATSDIELVPWTQGQILHLSLNIYIRLENDAVDAVNIVVVPSSEEKLKRDILEAVSMQELENDEIDSMFDVTASPEPGYPEDWEEATEDDIDALFN